MDSGSDRLVLSLVDLLEDNDIRIDDGGGNSNSQNSWNLKRLQSTLLDEQKSIQLAQTLLWLLKDGRGERCETSETPSSWMELLCSSPSDLRWVFNSISDVSSRGEVDEATLSLDAKLEYIHVLATSLQTERLSADDTQGEKQCIEPVDLLGDQASDFQINLLNECYSLLLEDYEQRRLGMRQRFCMLTSRKNPLIEEFKPRPLVQWKTSEEMSWLLDHFSRPKSPARTDLPPIQTTIEPVGGDLLNTTMDRGGRTDDDTRWSMPEWRSGKVSNAGDYLKARENSFGNGSGGYPGKSLPDPSRLAASTIGEKIYDEIKADGNEKGKSHNSRGRRRSGKNKKDAR